ncbi:MAG: IS66 family insertion sequence element accessory protein TnpB [Deltaproteobacteria bacterium]|nr:IS66 family insertion sequence element accessory protein TnpB [Deltaproteobacteria bacterium]
MSQSSYATKLRRKQKFWSTHIDAWQQSGLSQAEYCRRQGLKSYQLSYWVNRKPCRSDSLPALVEVALPKSTAALIPGESGLRLLTRFGEQLRIDNGFSPETLEKVVLVLRRLS